MGVLDAFLLDGKRAVVTGASRGLGRVMALALADVGADVVITGRTRETLEATAAEIRTLGRQAWIVQADMGVPTECEAACELILRDCGPIDLNLTSCFLGTRSIGRAMLARGAGGRIINIASMSALIANRGVGGRGYETGKAAVLHFTRCAAADWAPYGITVNAICPGLFMTDTNKAWNERKPEVIDALLQNVPLGRAGEPDEIGPLAVYLASPAASYVTGAAFVIDGGYTLW